MILPRATVLASDFVAEPYWWGSYRPGSVPGAEVPKETRVAIVGGGYAGLSAALELAKLGVEAVVLEAEELGFGASTRSGGGVSAGLNAGKTFTGRRLAQSRERTRAVQADAGAAFAAIDRIIAEEGIDCRWRKCGRFVGAWTRRHHEAQRQRVEELAAAGQAGLTIVPRERQREEIGSDLYYGGLVVERAGSLDPALYYKGLLEACLRRGVTVCARARAEELRRDGAGWRVRTSAGTVEAANVVIATNGYTGDLVPDLKRRMVPIASHVIATEPLPEGEAARLSPKGRTLSDTRRVLCYYRVSPDGTRLIFGGRARFTAVDAELAARVLHGFMVERFPQLAGVRVSHSWSGNLGFTFDALPHMGERDGIHFCLGCNGSGIAMMTHLGQQLARKIAGRYEQPSAFDGDFPGQFLYDGNPWFLPAVGSAFRMLDRLDRIVCDATDRR